MIADFTNKRIGSCDERDAQGCYLFLDLLLCMYVRICFSDVRWVRREQHSAEQASGRPGDCSLTGGQLPAGMNRAILTDGERLHARCPRVPARLARARLGVVGKVPFCTMISLPIVGRKVLWARTIVDLEHEATKFQPREGKTKLDRTHWCPGPYTPFAAFVPNNGWLY